MSRLVPCLVLSYVAVPMVGFNTLLLASMSIYSQLCYNNVIIRLSCTIARINPLTKYRSESVYKTALSAIIHETAGKANENLQDQMV